MNERSTSNRTLSRSFAKFGRLISAGVLMAALPFFALGCKKEDANTVKVGILHSETGDMAISEKSLIDAEKLAIEEINAAGGVLGKKIVPIVEDAQSEFATVFPDKAKKLLLQDKVVVVFGCWTSASRKNVLPVFEKNNGLLFYPVQYEGNESSKNIVYTGAAPNQQIIPAIEWLLSTKGGSKKKFYLLGSDYVFPRTANFIIRKYLKKQGIEPVGEEYTKMGETEYQGVIQNIKKADPDVIFSTINGGSNVNFYNTLAAAGITADKVPVVAVSVGEDELRGLDPSKVKGHLAAWNYFQSLDTPKNKEFVKKFQAKYGAERVTDDPIAAAYAQVYLWKIACEKAGSFDVDKVRAKLGEVEFDAPEGKIKISGKNFHVYKSFLMGEIQDNRQFKIIHSTEPIEPDPYPEIAFPGWSVDWTGAGLKKGDDPKIGK